MEISLYLIAGGLGWLVAQGLKYIIYGVKNRGFSARELYLSGGMPSAHSATTVAILVAIGALDGVDSAIFGLATLLTAIVMYDAVMVRRSSGEQGVALTALMKEQKSKVRLPRVAKGHTPTEVAIGGLVGLLVGFVILLISNNI